MSNAIQANYGHLVDFRPEKHCLLVTDFIESWEDINILLPIFDGIVSGRFSEDEFRLALIDLRARLWHTIRHFQRIESTLNAINDE